MPSATLHAQRTFAPDERSVAQARWFVREALTGWGSHDLTDSAVLASSELVTNAVVHAGTPVQVSLWLEPHSLRLEVQDLHPHRLLPMGVENPGDEAEHGRGLLIAATVASAWGVDYSSGTKRVWLRFDRLDAEGRTGTPHAVHRASDPEEVRVAVVELDRHGRVSSWNDDAQHLLGWTPHETVGRSWEELVDVPAGRPGSDVPLPGDRRWQGGYAVHRKTGASVPLFASHLPFNEDRGAVVLLVAAAHRRVLEWPTPRAGARSTVADPVGLPEETLTRLGLEDYLSLAVERSRDRLSAEATYLLRARDFDADLEVTVVSGLPDSLRGTRVERGTPGAPDLHNPYLPVVVSDLDKEPAAFLAGTGLRSLLVVPIVADGRLSGAIVACSDRPAGFTDDQAGLLQRIAGTLAAATDRSRLKASERERRAWLTFLAEAGDLLAGSLDTHMTMAITGQIVVPRLATWCALYLDDERRHPVLHQVWHRDERLAVPLRETLERTHPERVQEADGEQRWGSALTIALTARGRRIGWMVLGRPADAPLQGEVLFVAESVARRAALAIDNARTHGELQQVGEALQRSLLPAFIPEVPGLDVGVVYEAAGEAATVGGDFYDFFPVAGGRWCFAVGDVCGTGAEAAAVTGLARHTIRALTLVGFPVAATLERLNNAILDEGERGRFLTLVCGTIEPDAHGGVRLSLVCAGHPLPFLVREGTPVHQLGRPQSLLGVSEQVAFTAEEHRLERGDLLVVVTDGVLERRDGKRMLEEEGVTVELSGMGPLPAQGVAERIRRLVMDFAPGPQRDDMAILAIRVGSGG